MRFHTNIKRVSEAYNLQKYKDTVFSNHKIKKFFSLSHWTPHGLVHVDFADGDVKIRNMD